MLSILRKTEVWPRALWQDWMPVCETGRISLSIRMRTTSTVVRILKTGAPYPGGEGGYCNRRAAH